MSDDGHTGPPGDPPQVASIAARRARRRHPGPGPAGPAPPMPADRADLQAESADLPAMAPESSPPPDGSDILRRLEHATAGNGVIARLGEVMARITADDPATSAFWASLTGYQPRQDDPRPSPPRCRRPESGPRSGPD